MQLKYLQIKTKEDASLISKDAGYNIIKQALEESPWAKFGEINDKQIDTIIKLYLDYPEPSSRGLFVCFDNTLLVGLLAGVISDSVVIERQASELMWYVLPEYRKSGVGFGLIDMYEAWAKAQGCRLATLSHYENSDSDSLNKLLCKNSYGKIEVTYVKDLK